MGNQYLEKLYQEYTRFAFKEYQKVIHNRLGVKEVKNLSEKIIRKVFFNYMHDTYFDFVLKIRELYFTRSFDSVMKKFNQGIWNSYLIVEFLKEKDIIQIRKEKIEFSKNFNQFFIKPLSEKEITSLLKRKIKLKDLNKPVAWNLNVKDFIWKESFDQLPIDAKSAIFLISKISEYFPFKEDFVFIGDDDFVSIFLKLIYPEMKLQVFDADEELLQKIEKLSETLNIRVDTVKIDVREKTKLKKVYGCITNPPYNLKGSLTFLNFSSQILSEKGGVCFLVLGDEAIGRRYLELQKKMSKKFIIREISPFRVSYPFHENTSVIKEDQECINKLRNYGFRIDNKKVLFASLYVLDFVGKKFKDVKFNSKIYTYL